MPDRDDLGRAHLQVNAFVEWLYRAGFSDRSCVAGTAKIRLPSGGARKTPTSSAKDFRKHVDRMMPEDCLQRVPRALGSSQGVSVETNRPAFDGRARKAHDDE